MADAKIHMFNYWMNKKDDVIAVLEKQYPELLKQNEMLRAAIANIRLNQIAIVGIMDELNTAALTKETT